MSNFIGIGLGNSNDVFDKLKRDQNAIEIAINNQEKVEDTIINFFTYGYHIKDWLKKEGYEGVEEYINNNFELRICADLCNGAKHKILSKPPREKKDQVDSVNQSEITWDSAVYSFDSSLNFNSKTYSIELESGRKVEILYFAKTVVMLWDEFIFRQSNEQY
ncbi:hypothetical protein [Mangrovimonas xylaniphaga]|uniref:hypothetical protein n=1 Tax=Mangrovimonas xylaniphaga TaxID=1645915 RepID=UPI0006B641A1|nr:hypothetical protein [Mangrovimonas xylaniphaga]